MNGFQVAVTLALLAVAFGWGWFAGRDDAERGPARLRCRQVLRVIQSYVDGETDDTTARRLAAHLRDCCRCGLRANTYRAIKAAIARHDRPSPGAVARLRAFGERLSQPTES